MKKEIHGQFFPQQKPCAASGNLCVYVHYILYIFFFFVNPRVYNYDDLRKSPL